MDPLRLSHLVLLSLWGGVVLAETVVEVAMRDAATARHAARLHFLIDVLVEIPLLVGILATGAFLLFRGWPPSTLLVVKIACAVTALAANAWCAWLVVRRHRATSEVALLSLATRVRGAWIGVPFGLAALVIGLGWLHR